MLTASWCRMASFPPAGGTGANVAAAAGGALKFGGTPPGWAMPAGPVLGQ